MNLNLRPFRFRYRFWVLEHTVLRWLIPVVISIALGLIAYFVVAHYTRLVWAISTAWAIAGTGFVFTLLASARENGDWIELAQSFVDIWKTQGFLGKVIVLMTSCTPVYLFLSAASHYLHATRHH